MRAGDVRIGRQEIMKNEKQLLWVETETWYIADRADQDMFLMGTRRQVEGKKKQKIEHLPPSETSCPGLKKQ